MSTLPFPERGQQAPDYWDDDLKAYIDDTGAVAVTDAATYTDSEVATVNDRIDAQPKPSLYLPAASYTGPAATDSPAFTTGLASGQPGYSVQYQASGATVPADWPFDAFGRMTAASNMWSAKTSNNNVATVTTYRVMTDANEILLFTYTDASFVWELFIDGKPFSGNPFTPTSTTGLAPYGYSQLVFPTAKARLLEFRCIAGFVGIYVKPPYRCWKPTPSLNPSVAVVGDSYAAPTIRSDTAAGAASGDLYLRGIYQSMQDDLGITSLVVDGMGGTGYINPGGGGAGAYSASARTTWLNQVNPDVAIIHGGGANDLFAGSTPAQTSAAVISYFQAIRGLLPDAKLVFVEGFSPPGFVPATYNPNYITIRQQVQAALGDDAYYLDVATTRPPLFGSGYVTAPSGNGNSDIYVGSDSFHPTVRGNAYIQSILAPKIKRVLADDGSLAGQLI